jgi:hypothetical protein
MAYSQEYDRINYTPAAPIIEVAISNPYLSGTSHSFVAMIDSGADGTMLPFDVLDAVEARFLETKQMRGITGHPIKVDTYLITVHIGLYSIFGIEAISLEHGSEAIIGRDTINQLMVVLDGLSQTVTISD